MQEKKASLFSLKEGSWLNEKEEEIVEGSEKPGENRQMSKGKENRKKLRAILLLRKSVDSIEE